MFRFRRAVRFRVDSSRRLRTLPVRDQSLQGTRGFGRPENRLGWRQTEVCASIASRADCELHTMTDTPTADSLLLDRRAKEVFDRLADLGGAERIDALNEATADDPELRSRVEELLSVDEASSGEAEGSDEAAREATTFVAGRIVRGAAEALGSERARSGVDGALAGRHLGRYRLDRLIAAGGRGEGYEATQVEPIERRVAVKVIKPGFGSPEVVQRFEAERQVLSLMNHSGIARVFDAGAAEDGRPYFAMELVEGTAIDRYCDGARLDVGERLDLFVRVCDAVQHAHSKGVVHRDLKPSNVLVAEEDGVAVPKIIDFGIAKALDPMQHPGAETLLGTTLGTPEYMSPEQAGLPRDVDTRTDVYSLGVLLYELLAGSRPFPSERLRSGSLDEARRIVREEDPQRPSLRASTTETAALEARRTDGRGLRRSLAGDIDWICLQALEKEPDDRYASVGELAADVRAHRADLPIRAGRPSWSQRAGKFVRRNRLATAAAAFVGIGLLVGLVGLLVGIEQARAAQREAEAEAERTERVAGFLAQMIRGLDARSLGTAMVEELEQRLRAQNEDEGFRAELEAAADTVNPIDVARSVLADQLLDGAEATAADQFQDDPEVEGRLALTILAGYDNLSQFDRAEALAERALEIFDRVDRATPEGQADPDYQGRDTLRVRSALGNVYKTQARWDEARAIHEDVLARRQAVLGPDDPDSIASLDNLGMVADGQQDVRASFQYFERAYDAKVRVFGADHPQTLRQAYSLGILAGDLRQYDRSRALLEAALLGFEQEMGAQHNATLQARRAYANVLAEVGQLSEAEAQQRQVLAAMEQTLGAEDLNSTVTRDYLAYLLTLAMRFDEALPLYRRIRTEYAAAIGANHPVALAAEANTGRCLVHLGAFEEAEERLRAALDGITRGVPPGDRSTWEYFDYLGDLERQRGDLEAARVQHARVLEWAEAAMEGEADGSDHETADLEVLPFRLNYARTLLFVGESASLEQAQALLEQVVGRYRALYGAEHFGTMSARVHLLDARVRRQLADGEGDADDLATPAAEVLRALEASFGEGAYGTVEALALLAAVKAAAGRTDEAIGDLERAISAGLSARRWLEHPAFRGLSTDPRFEELRSNVG